MKITNAFLPVLVLVGSLASVSSAVAANDGDLEKVPLTTDSYCHEKFDAIQGRTLGTDDPTLKSASSGDVIDYYGPCNEKPAGKDQQWQQELDREHRFDRDYEG